MIRSSFMKSAETFYFFFIKSSVCPKSVKFSLKF